ncbi:MAG: hypothetical protein ABR990_00375 [Terracidiphilus sp.]
MKSFYPSISSACLIRSVSSAGTPVSQVLSSSTTAGGATSVLRAITAGS